ncbi:unnamed protein product [Fusarium fujikuroi]|uniref:Uncharacterized protein n=1 Tax=Fusarium fujikuroi TaxID=5127 RepID=A0A9Q9RG13_FUSFU|nr:unnamed protein product [Fusarium fujikuroi]
MEKLAGLKTNGRMPWNRPGLCFNIFKDGASITSLYSSRPWLFQSVLYLLIHTVKKKKKKKKKILKCVIVYIVLAGLQTHWLSLADGLQSLVSDTLPPTPCPKMEARSIIV